VWSLSAEIGVQSDCPTFSHYDWLALPHNVVISPNEAVVRKYQHNPYYSPIMVEGYNKVILTVRCGSQLVEDTRNDFIYIMAKCRSLVTVGPILLPAGCRLFEVYATGVMVS
jgi:hypothetical protein